MEKEEQLVVRSESFSLEPRNFQEAVQFAEYISKSELVPKEFRGKPQDVLIAVQMGHEIGLKAVQSLQSIAVINGRPCIWGDAVLGLIKASGLEESTEETWDQATETARCVAHRKGDPIPSDWIFSLDDARKAKSIQWREGKKIEYSLADKDTYKSYPRRMCQMRARGFALRDKYPDVLKGIKTREEVEDLEYISPSEYQEPEAIDITPKRMSESSIHGESGPVGGQGEQTPEESPSNGQADQKIVLPNFGKQAGKALDDPEVTVTNLRYYLHAVEAGIEDPKKSAYKVRNEFMRGVILAELQSRQASPPAQTEPSAPAVGLPNEAQPGESAPTDKPRFWTPAEAAGVGEALAAPCFDGDRGDIVIWFSKKHTPAEFSQKRIELDMRVAAFKRLDTEAEQQELGIPRAKDHGDPA
ncbi:MAG: hypothetical protein U1E51_07120 [Candidatus Binatia bacterium]|nr:hypothetical protein [Candidatus Binatia bacterium]